MNTVSMNKTDRIAVVTINHPPANAWNLKTMEAFASAVKEVESDPEIRVLVITGSGEKCFSAGFDVKDAAQAHLISPKGRETWRRLDQFPKPVIAALNGSALGGGLELALSCHFRIMADRSTAALGLTELNLGIIPGWGGTQRLPRLIGRSKALEMILFSRRLSAREALDIGLVDRLVAPSDFWDEVMTMARRLAERPPIAVQCVLESFSVGLSQGLEAGLNVEAEGSNRVRETEDRQEGFQAFLEKRKPEFKGR